MVQVSRSLPTNTSATVSQPGMSSYTVAHCLSIAGDVQEYVLTSCPSSRHPHL